MKNHHSCLKIINIYWYIPIDTHFGKQFSFFTNSLEKKKKKERKKERRKKMKVVFRVASGTEATKKVKIG